MAREHTPPEPATDPLTSFRDALAIGEHWFDALLTAVAQWDLPEEEVAGRTYSYLIGGEAFDWLLLAERLCEEADGAIPHDEKESLLFFGRVPTDLADDEFKRAIGSAKHSAHLNFIYGVTVEEALHLVVERDLFKERCSRIWERGDPLEDQVFERLYGRPVADMVAAFYEDKGERPQGEMSLATHREFTYWLSKFRMKDSDPARVASDTRRAIAQLSELQQASMRRARRFEDTDADEARVVEGEVVARFR